MSATVIQNAAYRRGPGTATTVRLRLTRRGRAVLTALVVLPIVAGMGVFALNGQGAMASGEDSSVSFEYVTVQPGDSLWQIAGEVAPGTDPRVVVSEIMSLNQLESASLSPGERLAIPNRYR